LKLRIQTVRHVVSFNKPCICKADGKIKNKLILIYIVNIVTHKNRKQTEKEDKKLCLFKI